MKINRSVPNDKDLKGLMSFFNKKAKEKGGGTFFKVMRKDVKLFTEWAGTQHELRAWLVTNQIPFDRITPLG